jgi:hypothetical protein
MNVNKLSKITPSALTTLRAATLFWHWGWLKKGMRRSNNSEPCDASKGFGRRPE